MVTKNGVFFWDLKRRRVKMGFSFFSENLIIAFLKLIVL
jgi:hypothetical protein